MTNEKAISIMQEVAMLNAKYDIWDDAQRARWNADRTFTDAELDEAKEVLLAEQNLQMNSEYCHDSDGQRILC